MPWLCDLALAAGMTLSGTCPPPAVAADPLPPDDPAVWAYKPPAPPVPAPVAAPLPAFPPVVIEREVVREVAMPAPRVPAPVRPAPPPGPDPLEQAVRAAYRSRAIGAGQPLPVVPAVAPATTVLPALPPGPLDPAATGDKTYKETAIASSRPVDNSRIVTTDRYISGILETGINTQLDGTTGGPVVIQTTRDVFGYHGRTILIPKGSRLVCAFKSLDKIGSTRAPLRCSRVLLGEHRAEIFGTKANATDVQGALGVSGEVDNRFFERYGTAFILAGVSAAVRAASSGSVSSERLADRSDLFTTGSEELSKRLGEITASALERTINLTPILKVAQGTRVQIRPDTDWYIAKME